MTAARSAAALLAACLLLIAPACGGAREAEPAAASPARPQTDLDRLTGRSTALTLDAAFLRELAALRVAPSAAGEATLQDDVLVLPVTGGDLTFPDPRAEPAREVLGRVLHEDGVLELTGPDDTVVRLEDLELDPDQARVDARVVAGGVVVAERVHLLTVDLRDMLPVRPGDGAGIVVLQGSRWALAAPGAQALRDALGVGFSPGLAVGVAETTVQIGR